jgi:aminomethyltransferase
MSHATAPLLRTPLHGSHRRLNARMVDFAGWDMPVQYPSGILAEHQAVRSASGAFDLSHMGRVFVRGVDALALVQACCTRDLGKLADGQAAYALLCLPNGGVLDDVIVYRLEPREILLVVNAWNREADVAWLSDQNRDLHLAADVDDHTLETALIGVQGPNSERTLQSHAAVDLEPLPGYAFVVSHVAGRSALVARTGYTGEDGFEVLVQASDAAHVWDTLLASDAVACGLGARDTLRTEAGMPLYGHELDETTNPYEARLGWAVELDKGQFVGRSALASIKSHGPSRRLVGLVFEPAGVPRSGAPLGEADRVVGVLTSGTFSPTLKRPIGLGYVPIALSRPGQRLEVEVRGKAIQAEVVRLPFVPHHSHSRSS